MNRFGTRTEGRTFTSSLRPFLENSQRGVFRATISVNICYNRRQLVKKISNIFFYFCFEIIRSSKVIDSHRKILTNKKVDI